MFDDFRTAFIGYYLNEVINDYIIAIINGYYN
jgi:hypothetical protein